MADAITAVCLAGWLVLSAPSTSFAAESCARDEQAGLRTDDRRWQTHGLVPIQLDETRVMTEPDGLADFR